MAVTPYTSQHAALNIDKAISATRGVNAGVAGVTEKTTSFTENETIPIMDAGTQKYAKITNILSGVKDSVTELTDTVEDQGDDIAALQTAVDALEAVIGGTDDEVDGILSQITTILTRLSATETVANAAFAEVNNALGEILTIYNQLGDVEGDVTTLQATTDLFFQTGTGTLRFFMRTPNGNVYEVTLGNDLQWDFNIVL